MPKEPDLIDSLIFTGVILLLLSQISEKITTFIRNYLLVKEAETESGKPVLYTRSLLRKYMLKLLRFLLLVGHNQDINRGQINRVSRDEQSRVEFAITKLSIFVGFWLAFAFHVNLFDMIKTGSPHSSLGWNGQISTFCSHFFELFKCDRSEETCKYFENFNYWHPFEMLIGFLATGVLLSFGSRFFHDALEILYSIKQTRRKLADAPYLYASQDINTLEKRMASPIGDPVAMVVELYKTRLRAQFPNIISIERVFDQYGRSILEIRLEGDKNVEDLKKFKFEYDDMESTKAIPINQIRIISNSATVTHQAQIKIYAGEKTRPESASVDSFGTMGFFAKRKKDNRVVLVTCAHVVNMGKRSTDSPVNTAIFSHSDTGQQEIGIVLEAQYNKWMDAAVIELFADVKPENFDRETNMYFSEYVDLDTNSNEQVWVNGAASEPKSGSVMSQHNMVCITDGNQVNEFYNLVRIEDSQGRAVSQSGDSGAIVFDKEKRAVGMIIAGNYYCSYAIPFSRILAHLQVSLINTQNLTNQNSPLV